MNDAEAEAMLIALSSNLQWEPYGGTLQCKLAFTEAGSYSIGKPAGMSRIAVIVLSRNVRSVFRSYCALFRPNFAKEANHEYKFYNSFNAAQAACERHHATGKWE